MHRLACLWSCFRPLDATVSAPAGGSRCWRRSDGCRYGYLRGGNTNAHQLYGV